MDFTESARYAEGLKAHAEFESFAQWVLSLRRWLAVYNKTHRSEIGLTFDGEGSPLMSDEDHKGQAPGRMIPSA